MQFTIIDGKEVQADLDAGAPTRFNSNFHTAAQAPDLTIPLHDPYSFDRWLPLIQRSRNLQPSSVQVVCLSRAQVAVVVRAMSAAVHTRVPSRAYAEDLEDEVTGYLRERLNFPAEGLFLRLSACSPKDGVGPRADPCGALHSVEDVLLQLTTSLRAWSALNNMLNDAARQEEPLYFLPFDARMGSEREYRVFCPPRSLRIAAVSQYRWHKPWVFAGDGQGVEEMEAQARMILAGIREVHAQIMTDLAEPGTNQLDDLARAQGFCFDVLYDQVTDGCVLVELNTFGVRSACGSCLFHWLRDRDLLYGQKQDDVEFRVVV